MTSSPVAPLTERVDVRISAAVRGLIAQRKLAPAAVAVAIGMKRSTLYNRLNNVNAWEADEVERLSHFFGVSRDSLYEGTSMYSPDLRARRDSNPQPSDPKVGVWHPRRERRRRDWQRTATPLHLSLVRCEDVA